MAKHDSKNIVNKVIYQGGYFAGGYTVTIG